MCAIAGLVNLPLENRTKDKMLLTMLRRGPDQQGAFSDGQCNLLHSRLSIIDPLGGYQPMTVSFGSYVYTIVYNGELYNGKEIRRELERNGHEFTTNCDTEIVLRAYIQWKEKALFYLNGIFAFAIWESREKKLFLARDRIGVKPLFYTLIGDGILFASEIKTILQYPSMKAQLDENGIAQLIMLGPGRVPGSGVLKNINELKPGHYALFENGNLNIQQYWKLLDREHTQSLEETADHIRYLVIDSIRRQMVSDVPIGTFLSGGLDSSIITAVCAAEKAKQGERLETFSVDYENNDKYFVPGKFQPNSDNGFIEIMRDKFNTIHNRTVLTPEELVNVLEPATIARDLPGMADVDFSLLAFCKNIRAKVKVGLSGECADEIFGGYPWFRDPEVRAMAGFPWAQNTKYRIGFLQPHIARKIDGESFVMDHYQQTIEDSDILPGTSQEDRRIKEMVNLNFSWFMQTLLDRKDRMSMYNSLEVRVPFCDYRIAEYMYSVPWHFKEYNGVEKGLLRYAVRDLLPKEVLWRKKSPYPKTYDPKYSSLVSTKMKQLLQNKNAPIFQIIQPQALEDLLTAEYIWPWYGQLMKVPQTIAYMLQINYWLEEYTIDICI